MCRASLNKAKDGVLAITRPGFEVKKYTHNKGGKVSENISSNQTSGDMRALCDLHETVAARKLHPDGIASQNSSIRVSGVDTSIQAAKLVGEAQKVPRCGICTMPMGDQPGRVCSKCK